jgi:4,5-dihydroxyphthalate decarboxylase
MTNDLTITLAAGDYEHLRDLLGGRVRVQGARIRWLELPLEEIFYRFTAFREWEVSEMSLAKYCSLRSRGDDSLMAIPVFPSRVFRHSAIYVRADGSVRAPSNLAGRHVGIPEWTQTAGVYVRGMLADEHGVGIDQVDWVQAGLNEPGREELVPPALGPGIRYRAVADRRLGDLLLDGDVDAVISARAPDVFLDGSRRIRRLFEDTQEAEQASLQATGIFPIMHTVAIRRDVLDEHPWLAPNLVTAFEESKRRSLRRLLDDSVARLPIPWASAGVERAVQLLGADPWPYGIEPNRTTLEAFLRYAHEQGICARMLTPEELFPASVQRTYRV